ncbi:MAG: hypothetical protein PHC66_04855 [Candidatus Nanoarchaeia archaeon]|nr:hypothetical protein [Candidatus Nanoarchaeia archaeon]
MKAQSAIEFLSVIALGLILLIVTSYLGYNYVSGYFFDTNGMNAKQMVSVTTSAANLVYSQGLNASTKVTINVPGDIVRNRTYIHDQEINIRFSDPPRDAIGQPAASIYGTMPVKPGLNVLYLQMTSEGVKLKIDDNVAFVGVKTYNDSGYLYENDTFSAGATLYYQVVLEHFNGTAVDSAIDISYYDSNSSLISSASESTVNGIYNGTISVIGNTGHQLISVSIASEKVLGTALFNVT